MKFFLAQINPTVGDLEGNARKIVFSADQARRYSADIFSWKNYDKVLQEVKLQILKRDGYPIKSNTLKMLVTKRVDFEISSLNIPNISSSNVRLNKQYSDLPKSLVDIVKKNNLYLSN